LELIERARVQLLLITPNGAEDQRSSVW